MKKGFTLIELLMVMIIAATLVAVALPKYQRALERSRSLEGITNARSAAEYVNTQYLLNNGYATNTHAFPLDDLIKKQYFTTTRNLTTVSGKDLARTLDFTRLSGSGWNYKIQATVEDGKTTQLGCVNTTEQDDCAELDLTGNLLN